MRLNINLATQKFEDARAFYARWGTGAGILLLLTISLGWLAWSNHRNSVQAGKRIAELQKKIADLDREEVEIKTVLDRTENHDVREQSRFWNGRIAQRAFSWTQLFSDLERIMPNRAYVTSVQPEATKDRKLKLKIKIDAEKHDDALELLKKMEKSTNFRSPRPLTETFHPSEKNAAAYVQIEIEADYTPATVIQRTSTEKTDTKEGT